MRYEQAKPLVQKLMEIAVLYHGSPSMLRKKISTAVCEGIPELDPACMERGCPMVETFPPKEKA
jgi:hypothetical protein